MNNNKDIFHPGKRDHKKIFLLLLFINLLSTCVYSQAYPYRFNYLTVDEGLSHTDANDIVQDQRGYIWIATNFGLDRFDGYSVRKYYNNNLPLKNAFKNRLRFLYPDQQGKIWLGTEDGLQCFDPRTEKYTDFIESGKNTSPYLRKLYQPGSDLLYGLTGNELKLYKITGTFLKAQKLTVPAGVYFSDMAPGQDGQLYLSGNRGIWVLDKNQQLKKLVIRGLPGEYLSSIYTDRQNHLLTVSGNSIFLLTKETRSKDLAVSRKYVLANGSQLKDIVQNNNGDYWVNTGSGLLRLGHQLQLIQTIDNSSSPHSLNSVSLSKTLIDRSGCLWVCTFGGGVNYCDLSEKLFYTLQHNSENPNSLSGNHVRAILQQGNDLWIGTHANGLNQYNLATKKFTFYNTHHAAIRLKSDEITSLTFDNTHNLWIGSASGIEILKADHTELWKPKGYDKFPSYVVETIVKDYYGNIWFGNHMNKFGVIYKDRSGYYRVKYYGEGFFIFADTDKPQLFVSSTNGLKRLLIDSAGNITKTFEYRGSSRPNSLSSDYTYPVSRQNDSTYWVGTIGGGLNRMILGKKKDSYTIRNYNAAYGVFNDVESMEIDYRGNIWMGGNGLECLNPQTGKLVRYDKNDGLQGNSFKVGSSFKGADGSLYFGGINGLNYFHPKDIRANNIAAKPILTDILINNQKPVYGQPDSSANTIANAIGYDPRIVINYLQNNFVIFFSSMHFANPLKCRYRYKLIGFDKDWKYTDGTKPNAAYSNLDYKNYRFIAEATNNDGIWSKTQAATDITITPPWWKSNMAKIFYFLLISSCLAGIYIFQARWYRLKKNIAVREVNERKREEMHKQREEMSQQQLMFFTNISHEFRTPLTLLMGPLENLISQNKDISLNTTYQLMSRNAKRLLNLISELMNFKKVADHMIKLQVQPVDIDTFCLDITTEFENLAVQKNIHFTKGSHLVSGLQQCLLDAQIMEKILLNLLNNSFKYTTAGGRVSFELFSDLSTIKSSFETGYKLLNNYRADKYIYFRISDSGMGISSDSITRIFDLYYRISQEQMGSGVGLALVKNLTKIHKGDIYVYSEKNTGTEIIIGIPLGKDNYNESERLLAGNIPETRLESIDHSILTPLPENEIYLHQPSPKTNKHILIVEDNRELRSLLRQTFEEYYFIYEAEDGNEGLQIAIDSTPDLIISDVVMPGMDGLELCRSIKETFETRHIPFIILSAKDALDTKIEGMQSGADYYFAKPLSTQLLLLTVQNIFEQAEKLKTRYTNNYLTAATELAHSEKDKTFLQQLLNLIEENIEDPDLDVDFLCNHLYISRTKLYQKIKSISDQSVGEFIRTTRLKKAVHIMTHENVTLYEVADRIGLQSSSTFSRAFKKEYGKSPLQYIQSLK